MGTCFMLHRAAQRIPKFSYTGSYQVIDDGHGNWRIKLLTSGTLTFLSTLSKGIDVFLVGSGAGGVSYVGTMVATASGGAGYTKTQKNVSVTKGTAYTITVGAGSAAKSSSGSSGSTTGNAGGATSAFGYTANGGGKAECGYRYYPETYDYNWAHGGHGGSGGGTGSGAGGTDGGNGTFQGAEQGYAGSGQGTTTREFGEPDGTMYAQGGGSSTPVVANSGNGGKPGNDGSSGIVVIRNHR